MPDYSHERNSAAELLAAFDYNERREILAEADRIAATYYEEDEA